jgi:hypothetical protein
MKEYKIGEEFEFNGVNLRCDKSYDGLCCGCYIYEKLDSLTIRCQRDIGICCDGDRSDEVDVIFVEVTDD